jgi:hypothetical protein
MAQLQPLRSQSVPRESGAKRTRSADEDNTDLVLSKKFKRLSVDKKRRRDEEDVADMLDELELEKKKKRIRSKSVEHVKQDESGKYLRFIYDKKKSPSEDLKQIHLEHKLRISSADYTGPNLPKRTPTPSAKPFFSSI